uniref:A disintegrin and metalloproteinase with thrombospondin motifs 7 n=1 Tax=Suricata suricatta TaxID=37032 RepID=A0A673U8E5_SURSU
RHRGAGAGAPRCRVRGRRCGLAPGLRGPGQSSAFFREAAVQDPELEGGLAAISACDGLTGVFRLSDEDYFIEPLEGVPARPGHAQPHVVYKRQAPERRRSEPRDSRALGACGVQGMPEARRERWEQRQRRWQRPRRLQQRSVSREKWVETLVVADTKMVEYHGQPQVESYVLTIMNMVAGLFHDPSIGNPIHVTVVRLVLLEDEEEDLKITHHADNTLRSFCKWQKSINMKGDAHPLHHDTAILLTRLGSGWGSEGGLGGARRPQFSCGFSALSALPPPLLRGLHDGSLRLCPLPRPPLSHLCSRGWGLCLDDAPTKDVIDFPSVPPGVLYDVGHQCRLQYGAYSAFCDDMDNVCHTLWCSVGTTCHSKLDAAVDGTRCGESKWCLNGECVPVGFRPEAVDGGWSGWSAWSVCSRSCGVGVQSAERQCTQPVPKYKGKYCVGERKRFRLCNLQACPPGRPSFRHVQCSHFDAMLYKGQLHTWVPVFNDASPCELHCRPSDEYFAEKLRDAVIDGTPCSQGRPGHDLCINGICKNVGCDFEIDSGAVEDRCGVCHGNGSTCHTVSGTFEESEGLGYVDVGLIPAGAREIHIEEVAEAANFLALRSEDPQKYFLNGGWTIQWGGDYQVAGTTFTYARTGNWENLTAPGPTDEPIWIQLLFQENNPGVRYEYTIHREADGPGPGQPPEFSWSYGPWSKCTVTCGTGEERVSPGLRPDAPGPWALGACPGPADTARVPRRWWAGEWQACSRSCGPGGLARRAVLCIRSVGLDEQRALPPPACLHLPQPPAESPCNQEVLCPATWAVGNWSQCSATCGDGTQHRSVLCTNDTGIPCDEARRPASRAPCPLPSCPRVLDTLGPEGSGSGSSSHELLNEIDFIAPRPPPPAPPSPAGMGNAIEEDPALGPPGPVFVDDFYYDYNFINFHEDLSYGPLEDPAPDLAGAGGWTAPPLSSPAEPSSGTPLLASEPPGAEKEGALGDGPSTPWPGQAGLSPLPPLRPTPGSPLANSLPEEDTPVEAPDSSPPGWPPTSASGTEMPAAPGSQNKLPGGEDSQSWTPPPRWERTNELSEEEEEEGGASLPQGPRPTSPTLSSMGPSRPSPSPDAGSLWTAGTVAWEPALSRGPGPVDSEPWPATGGAPAPPPPLPPPSPLPETQGRDGALEPWPPVPWTPAAPGAFLPTPPGPEFPGSAAPTPAQGSWTNGSSVPEAQPDPSLAAPLLPAANASWEAGNWSECSTTCGLGAVWRPVRCSSGREDDCAPEGRPQPARRCHLRPCAAWHAGNWSKCSRSCGGGSSARDVQCVDTQDLRPLRPFHCQPGPAMPPARRPCGTRPCLSWYVSSWRECSEACGGGEQQRLVTCPEPGLCEEALRPNSTRSCNTHPCTKWVVGPWGQCSAPCGGGVQRRLVRCVNTQTGLPEEDSDQCGHEAWPESARPCGSQDCELSEAPRESCRLLRALWGPGDVPAPGVSAAVSRAAGGRQWRWEQGQEGWKQIASQNSSDKHGGRASGASVSLLPLCLLGGPCGPGHTHSP